MKAHINLLACVIGLFGILATGNALKCYVCNSEIDGHACETDPPSAKFLVECTPETAKPAGYGATSDRPIIPSTDTPSSTTPTSINSSSLPETSSTRKTISPHEILAISPYHSNESTIENRTFHMPTTTKSSIFVTPNVHEAFTSTTTEEARNARNLRETSNPSVEGFVMTTVVDYTMCRKDDVTIPDQHNGKNLTQKGKRMISRSCGWLGKPENVCRNLPSESLVFIQCACMNDSCNSSNVVLTSPVLLTILALMFTA